MDQFRKRRVRFSIIQEENECFLNNTLTIQLSNDEKLFLNRLPRSQLVPSPWLPMEKNQTRYLKIEAENPDMMNEKMPFHHRLLALEQDMIPRRGGNMNL